MGINDEVVKLNFKVRGFVIFVGDLKLDFL